MGKDTNEIYQQNFRNEWLQMEVFSKLICEIPGDNTKGHCKFCKAEILARYSILVEHGESKNI